MAKPDYDLCIIGGGINGTGIARDAVGRGQSVLLVESGDLAGATSSASTKLIHGGLRYLEYYEFHLVSEALKEREILLTIAPHIVWPLTFVLPHDSHLRPAWMIRAGLFLYDHLAGLQKLQKSHGLKLRQHAYGAPLQDHYKRGFSYADCRTDDARLVVLNAIDAAERGAHIMTHTTCTALKPKKGGWQITLHDVATGKITTPTAAKIVNAAGPWVHDILEKSDLVTPKTPHIRLVKGSHIVVPKMYDGDQAYILQQPDRRIVFAIPYEQNYTMIGTTDENYEGDVRQAVISQAEMDYLCAAVSRSFKKKITPPDIVLTWTGVRPLLDDGRGNASSVTRDFKLVRDDSHGAPLLSVFGGKITTYRVLAEQVVDDLCGGKAWTATAVLPGGNIPGGDMKAFLHQQEDHYYWLPEALVKRYVDHYGTRMDMFLDGAQKIEDLGRHFGDGLYEAEIRYLIAHEWARTIDDILWRRTKMKLHVTPATAANLERALPRMVREITGSETGIGT